MYNGFPVPSESWNSFALAHMWLLQHGSHWPPARSWSCEDEGSPDSRGSRALVGAVSPALGRPWDGVHVTHPKPSLTHWGPFTRPPCRYYTECWNRLERISNNCTMTEKGTKGFKWEDAIVWSVMRVKGKYLSMWLSTGCCDKVQAGLGWYWHSDSAFRCQIWKVVFSWRIQAVLISFVWSNCGI